VGASTLLVFFVGLGAGVWYSQFGVGVWYSQFGLLLEKSY